MKKLVVVLVLAVSGFVNGQDALYYTFSCNQFKMQF